jgi:DNA segregation ATPase FtsK/SpoIIIE-like protein
MIVLSIVVSGLIISIVTLGVYFSKKQVQFLHRLNRIDASEQSIKKLLIRNLKELKTVKKSFSIKNPFPLNPKNKHTISGQAVKELLVDLEAEGVLKKDSTRSPKEIIIIQEFIHHSDHDDEYEQEDITVILDEARELVKNTGIAAPHLLESQLRIPQDIAESVLDRLEEEGVVGPPDGSSHRTVLVRK